jgi:hypothetical protein
MKKYLPVLIFVAITFGPGNEIFAQSKTKKTLFVIVDGISSDSKEKIATPNLDAIAKIGGYTRAHWYLGQQTQCVG